MVIMYTDIVYILYVNILSIFELKWVQDIKLVTVHEIYQC